MNSTAIKQRLQRHLITCSAVPGAAIALGGQQCAEAAVSYIVPGSPIVIPNSFAGIYFNIENGLFDTAPGNVAGWDVNPYGSNGVLTWYAGAPVGSAIGTNAASGGQVIPQAALTDFSAITWETDGFNQPSNSEIQGGGTFFVAMQFRDSTAATNNAWLELTVASPGGFPAQINRWAYAPVGEPGFAVGAFSSSIPEASVPMLALLAAGAAGLRRRRAA
jgi:MYXO-CTERM domain-containing protein